MNNKFESGMFPVQARAASACEKYEKFVMDCGCPTVAHEEATVTVPIAVRAHAELGDVELNCMGHAIVTRNSDLTPGKPCAVSKFTVSQKIRVDIPIKFNMEAEVGQEHVEFASLAGNDHDRRQAEPREITQREAVQKEIAREGKRGF
ncbi:MAG: hypothetical protein FWD39_04875 [Clostridiales bacterium]|nr:hypothetical protein [Clostridiales bacterium]